MATAKEKEQTLYRCNMPHQDSKDTRMLPLVACGNEQLIGAEYESAAAKVAKRNLNWVLPVDF